MPKHAEADAFRRLVEERRTIAGSFQQRHGFHEPELLRPIAVVSEEQIHVMPGLIQVPAHGCLDLFHHPRVRFKLPPELVNAPLVECHLVAAAVCSVTCPRHEELGPRWVEPPRPDVGKENALASEGDFLLDPLRDLLIRAHANPGARDPPRSDDSERDASLPLPLLELLDRRNARSTRLDGPPPTSNV
jgi:hypothetical protein